MCSRTVLFLVFLFAFFFTAAHFHLAGRWHFSFSHRCYEISCLSSNEIRLLCFYSLALALSPLSTWAKTSKITSKILDFVVVFFLCKSQGGSGISRQKNLELLLVCNTCWLNYFALAYVWCGRTGERTVTWLSKFFGCIGHSHHNAPYLPLQNFA